MIPYATRTRSVIHVFFEYARECRTPSRYCRLYPRHSVYPPLAQLPRPGVHYRRPRVPGAAGRAVLTGRSARAPPERRAMGVDRGYGSLDLSVGPVRGSNRHRIYSQSHRGRPDLATPTRRSQLALIGAVKVLSIRVAASIHQDAES